MKSPASSTTSLKSLAFLCTVFSLSSLILVVCSISAGAQTYPLQKGQKPIPIVKDQMKPVAIPDLTVVNGSAGWKVIPREGERVVDGNFHFTVRNIGTAPSPASLTRITCKPLTPGAKSCPKGMTGTLNTEFLDPSTGQVSQTTELWPPPPPSGDIWKAGTYQITIVLNSSGVVKESNKANNVASYRFTVAAVPSMSKPAKGISGSTLPRAGGGKTIEAQPVPKKTQFPKKTREVLLTNGQKLLLIPKGSNYAVQFLNPNGSRSGVPDGVYVSRSGDPITVKSGQIPLSGINIQTLNKIGKSAPVSHIDKMKLNIPIKVIFPNGGELLEAGLHYTVQWEGSSVDTAGNVIIHLIGADISDVITLNDGSEKLILPKTVAPGSYKLRINVQGTHQFDNSDQSFTVVNQEFIKISSPRGGEIWQIGETRQIRWETGGGWPGKVFLWLGKENTPFMHPIGLTPDMIASASSNANTFVVIYDALALPNTGSYSFTIPGELLSQGMDRRVVIRLLCRLRPGLIMKFA